MSLLQAKVKAVLSGDTLVLANAKGQERNLSLAYVSAPRLKREGDEVGEVNGMSRPDINQHSCLHFSHAST